MNWEIKSFEKLTTSELYAILQLRAEVFVVEQDCPYQDVDGKDMNSYHVCGWKDDKLVAYARIVKPGISYSEISIGRVVVSELVRGTGTGILLMQETMRFIKENLTDQPIRISAQTHLSKFYNDLGFISTGKNYLEDNIPHTEMLFTPSYS